MSVKRTISLYALSALLVMNLAGTATVGYAADLAKSAPGLADAGAPAASASEASSIDDASFVEKPVVSDDSADASAAVEGPSAIGDGDSPEKESPTEVGQAASACEGNRTAESTDASSAEEQAGPSAPEENLKERAKEPIAEEAVAAVVSSEEPDAGEVPPVTLEGSTLYANGVAVVIKKASDGRTYVYDETGEKKLLEQSISISTVYGGSKNGPVHGDTSVTLDGAYVSTVYGGGYSDGTGNADVSGSASVAVKGIANANNVHGGGHAVATKGDASANVSGAVSVVVSATPTTNHDRLYGGGEATSSSGFSASATTGPVSLYAVDRLYSARGGGYASATGSGVACADVKGPIALSINDADVREVYGAGFAQGAQARAQASSVTAAIEGTEVMLVYGGGTASSGCADVTGPTSVVIDSSPNLYGYTKGGGQASGGGSADVASASIVIRDSEGPVTEQFEDYWAAQAIYAGGDASGAGSHANVRGAASVSIESGHMAGNVYGGGSGSSGASTTVGSTSIAIKGVLGYDFDQHGSTATGRLSVYAAGETDGSSPALSQGAASVRLNNTEVENLWGAVTTDGNPAVAPGKTSMRFEGAARTSTLACVDVVEVDEPLRLAAFLWKAEGVPTTVIAHGIAVHEPAVVCDDADSDAGWFALAGGTFDYAIEGGASVWRVAERRASIDVEDGEEGSDTPPVALSGGEDLADKLLSDEDREALESGKTVGFKVQVEGVSASQLDGDTRAALDSIAESGGCTVAVHLDIAFLKVIDGVEHPMNTTAVPVRLTFSVPEEYRTGGEGSSAREFSVIRVHENADGSLSSTLLPDIDDTPETVTIETDAFSVYALAYADKEKDPVRPVDPTPDGKGDQGGEGEEGGKGGSGSKGDQDDQGSKNPPDSTDPEQKAGDAGDNVDRSATPPAKTSAERAAAVYHSFGVRTGDDAAALVYVVGGLGLIAFNLAAIAFLRRRARGSR